MTISDGLGNSANVMPTTGYTMPKRSTARSQRLLSDWFKILAPDFASDGRVVCMQGRRPLPCGRKAGNSFAQSLVQPRLKLVPRNGGAGVPFMLGHPRFQHRPLFGRQLSFV